MKRYYPQLVMFMLVAAFAMAASDAPMRIISPSGDYSHPGGGVSDKELAWHKYSRLFENEHNYLLARLDQGYWLSLLIFTFKYGPQQGWAVYGIVVNDEGKMWFAKREARPRDVSLSHENISWKSGGTSLGGSYPEFTYKIDEDAFQADLTATAMFEGWNTGIYYYEEGKKAFWEVPIYMPWGTIKGTITLDGEEMPVTGLSYGDHVHGSHRFDLVDPIFYSIRGIYPLEGSPKVNITVSYNRVHPTHGNTGCPSLMLMDTHGFLKATQKVTIHGADYFKDENTGYSFPRSFIVEADDDGFKLRGVFKARMPIEILDILSQLPPYARQIALKFFKLPVFSKWDGLFEGIYTLDGKQVRFRIRSLGEANFIGGPQAIPDE